MMPRNYGLLFARTLSALLPLLLFQSSSFSFGVGQLTLHGRAFNGAPVHEGITVDSLYPVSLVSPPFAPPISYTTNNGGTIGFDSSAIGTIMQANADTDSAYSEIPLVHFDNEQFARASNRLINLRAAVVKLALAGQYSAAQRLLGQGLHTVQDFYSHTTWVEGNIEMGSTQLAPLGRVIYANPSPLFPTCSALARIAGSATTSGYWDLAEVVPSIYFWTQDLVLLHPEWPSNKCIHGSPVGLAGIHKDADGRPNFANAYRYAVVATTQFVNDIIGDISTASRPVADVALCGLMGQAADPACSIGPVKQFRFTFAKRSYGSGIFTGIWVEGTCASNDCQDNRWTFVVSCGAARPDGSVSVSQRYQGPFKKGTWSPDPRGNFGVEPVPNANSNIGDYIGYNLSVWYDLDVGQLGPITANYAPACQGAVTDTQTSTVTELPIIIVR